MSLDGSISRLSYAEARSSNAEAMMGVAKHQRDSEQASSRGESQDAQAIRLGDETRHARSAHHVDKTA